jgi:thymidylate kinase
VYFGLWPDVRNPSTLSTVGWPLRRPFRAVTRYGRGWLASRRGRLVLFDRYVYDAAAPPRDGHLRLKRLYFGVLLRCVPAPDLVLLLDAPGEVLFARKGEMTPATLDEDRVAISDHVHRRFARRGRPRVVVLDATRTAADVCDQAVAAIWAPAAERLTARGGRAS